ncbi:hypothetical protein [Croceicoccus naphthovorans]|uniref:Uncharacterized protein n=1 Tax=Croceicoccus naphthovorans TaxID=1348774 RepID=A0A0G3XJI2_9SPHN|nr:hypothetical protein [Croceicoccus naphthovorans]AKM10759.1 hypothetical protein AB433_13555 [Croceicoccus naphthovorans]MBB3988952.1 UDP-N-acetylmuramoyl-tripeptide--D-alanyl-D-alanine ligase [Croceicoccus naphthovorans]
MSAQPVANDMPVPNDTRRAIIEEADGTAYRTLWRAHTVALSVGGAAHGDFAAHSIATSPAAVVPGALYFAHGELDAAAALARGAVGVVSTLPARGAHVLVDDIDEALAKLARAARNRARATIIAEAGFSCGSAPAALYDALDRASRGLAYAPDVEEGLHAGMAGLAADRSYALFGVSADDSIESLRPHLFVGGREMSRAEGIRAGAALQRGGAAVLPADHPDFACWRAAALDVGAQVYGYGRKASSDICLLDAVRGSDGGWLVTAEMMGQRMCYALGDHFGDACASLAVLGAMRAAGASLGCAALALQPACDEVPGKRAAAM